MRPWLCDDKRFEFIGDLAGGRLRRVTLNFFDDVYITDFAGCEGGEIQFGPEI